MKDDRIKFHCVCGKRISVPPGSEGRKARCPVCETVVVVPGGPTDESSIITPASLVWGKLIVADYDFEKALNLRAFLARKGFEVRSATEGLGLRLMVQEDVPDAILLSCDLPNMEEEADWLQLRATKCANGLPPALIALQGPDDAPPPVKVDRTVGQDIGHRELLKEIEGLLLAREKAAEAEETS